jgi:ribosomal protein S18 acetylase RimI-like enzyme
MVTPESNIVCRPARADDLAAITRVRAEATNLVRERHGFGERRIDPATPEPFYRYALEHEPEGFLVAEADGAVIGMAIAWVRDWLWFLGYLFIAPEWQGAGVGQVLLTKTLELGNPKEITTRALIAMAYNPSSAGLYVRHGLYPAQPIYRLKADTVSLSIAPEEGHACDAEEPLGTDARSLGTLAEIDTHCIGLARERHHRYYLGLPGVQSYLVSDGRGPLGYAYLHPDGQIGPVGAVTAEALMKVLVRTVRRAVEQGTKQVSLFVPGTNRPALAFAMAKGMRVSEPYMLMSSRPIGNLERYLLHSAGTF